MKATHSLPALCAALEVPRSGDYAWRVAAPSARQVADTALRADIRALHKHHRGRYGAPRLGRELQKRGQGHGPKRIARLLRADGLRGRGARRYVPRTTDSNHDQPLAPNRRASGCGPQRSQPDLGQ